MIVRTLAALTLLFVMLQLVRPKLTSGPAPAELMAPSEVKQILEASCYPCHSNQRRLSWFDEIVPAYWLVAHDVRRAREHLNFSEIGAQPAAKQRAALFQAINFVGMGVMPLPSYLRLHPQAAITPAQLKVLKDFLLQKAPVVQSRIAGEIASLEYRKWIKNADSSMKVQNSPNGIPFIPNYKDWKVVDSTSRFDADTLRIILGNDTAMEAIADNNTNPWPDGTMFAKVGWHKQADKSGVLQAGAFLKVGFMIKDRTKYASTAGWGWAEWEGADLKPYGIGPDFARECVTCHSPLRKNDYVFTMPIQFAGGRR